jgi:outer membrane receptor protein involved in Fe transport
MLLASERVFAQEPPSGEAKPPDIDQSPPTQPEIGPPPGIEAIEVTGERLDASDVQDEASAITAFSGADLDRASIVNMDTLQFSVPGLHVGQSGTAPIITLRGIGTENASLTGEPGVAFHVDGINLSRPAGARVAFFDLETLDVKRGPQGLLGGKNSTSGSINLITNKPKDEFEITGDVLTGNYDRVRMRGALNIPTPIFGEGSAMRFAYYHEDRDGYLDDVERGDSRDPFDADDRGLRAHFLWAPSDTFNWLFSYNYFKQGGAGPQADVVPRHRDDYPCALGYRVAAQKRGLDGKLRWTPEQRDVFVDTDLTPSTACAKSTVTLPARRVAGWVEPSLGDTGKGNGFTPYRDPETGEIFIDPRANAPLPVQIQQGTDANGPFTKYLAGQLTYFADPASEDTDPRKIHLDLPSKQDNRYWGWSTTMDWDAPQIPLFGETHVKLLGGFQFTGGDFAQDFDATDARIVAYGLDDKADQYSTELQWSGLLGERLDWQTSLFYLHEKASRDVDVPNLVQPNLRGTFLSQTTNNKSYGAALNTIYNFTEDLHFSLGGRWIKDRKRTFLDRYAYGTDVDREAIFRGCGGNLDYVANPIFNSNAQPPHFGDNPKYPNHSCSTLQRGTMWGAGLDWRPFGGDHLLYAKIDRGFKSGGFQAGAVGDYSPERIWAYAVGSKSEFFDQRLRLNLEGFFYAYSDLQLVVLDGFSLRTENTDARMHGFDVEAEATPLDGLRLSAVISFLKTETLDYFSLDPTTEPPGAGFIESIYINYQNTRLRERENAEALYQGGTRAPGSVGYYENRDCYIDRGDPTEPRTIGQTKCGLLPGTTGGLDDFSGNELSRSPEWKYTLSGEYEIPLGRFGSLTPRIQYTWQDDTYFRAFNRDFDLQEAHHLTNAKLIWSSPEQMWSVEVFVENIEDETPKQNILIGPRQIDSPPLAWYGPPRFYGVQVGFRY